MTNQFKLLALTLALTASLSACNSESSSSGSGGSSGGGSGGGTAPDTKPTPAPEAPDPFYLNQWHLKNTGQLVGAQAGEDINVEPVWAAGNKGEGLLVAIVDDGLQMDHPDLRDNVAPGKSWDYLDHDTTPTPTTDNFHGTNVAGIIGARDLNGEGVRGVAPRASLAAYNLLANQGQVFNTDIADSMTRNVVEVAVSNNSWGLAIDGQGEPMKPTDSLWQNAVLDGVTRGRDGKGTIYVWAGGNGGSDGVDNSNYDYQANNRHVISACAVAGNGEKASYSEPGANLWVCAPGGDEQWLQVGGQSGWYYLGMTTTDLIGSAGVNPSIYTDYENLNYTDNFAGTSAAAPVVSGVAALVLAANPALGWRDVRLILAESARKNDPTDSDWATTTPEPGQPQYHINHKYGFGVVDAEAAVALAQSWVNVGDEVVIQQTHTEPMDIPDYDGSASPGSIEQTINISGLMNDHLIIEYVEVDFNSDHQYAGDLEVVLTGPQGTESRLAETHDCMMDGVARQIRYGTCAYNYDPWTFGSARHLGESSVGDWTLKVTDKANTGSYGQLLSWTLRIYGRRP